MGRKLSLSEVIDVVSDSLVGAVVDKEGKLTSDEVAKLACLKYEIEEYINIGTSSIILERFKNRVEEERNKTE